MTPALRCEGVVVSMGGTQILDGIDIEVAAGETMALLGPSGSGKTTLLYAIAGLLEPDRGTIEISGEPMSADIGPEGRSISMVFQNYALWPHLDALHTVAYPLERQGLARATALERAGELLDMVGIGGLGDRLPDRLSGGEQQRVGLARALASDPALFLFDEPTAHLDSAVRQALQAELVSQRVRGGAAALYTTHDAAEALAVADRIAVLRRGRIVQTGTPEEVYERPSSRWIAALTGPVSSLGCELIGAGDGLVKVRVGSNVFTLVGDAGCEPGRAKLLIRPGWATLGGPVPGMVEAVRYEGSHTDYLLKMGDGTVIARAAGPAQLGVGDQAGVTLDRGWVLGPRR